MVMTTETTEWLAWLKEKGVDTDSLKGEFTTDWKDFEVQLSENVKVKFKVRLGNDGTPEIKNGRLV